MRATGFETITKLKIIGTLERDPEILSHHFMPKINKYAILRIKGYNENDSNYFEIEKYYEKRERHFLIVSTPYLVNFIDKYLSEGSRIYLEVDLQIRNTHEGLI